MLGLGVSLRSAALSLPTFATAQFKRFFCGRDVRCMLPGRGRFLHMVVLYGCQGADREAEKLALTVQLLDAALGEQGAMLGCCLAKGISAGLWTLKLLGHLLLVRPGVTCKRSWDSAGGSRRDFMVGCPRVATAAAAVSGCMVREDRWILPHLAVRAHLQCSRWAASWLPVLDKSRGSKSAEVQRICVVYNDRLQFMTRDDALGLNEALEGGDVSCAWLVWSSAAETALADAYQFAGGPVPSVGLVLGRGSFVARSVRLGGPKILKARRNFADPLEGGDVFLYPDASTAVSLDLRRRFKAVGDVLHAMIRDGVTLARSLELTVQWDGIIRVGPVYPLSVQILRWLGGVVLGNGCRWSRVSIVGCRISFTGLLCIAGRKLYGGGGIG